MERTRTDLHVHGLEDHAAVLGPKMLKLENEVLQVHLGENRGTVAERLTGVKET